MVRVELYGMSDETQREVRDDGEDLSDNRSPAGLVPAGEDAGVGVMRDKHEYIWLPQSTNTWQSNNTWQRPMTQSKSMQISNEAFSALFETMQKENLRNEVNRIMEEANKDVKKTASNVYHECADELRWLINNLDKAVDCMISGDMVAGGIRLQMALSRMQETERKWWAMAEKTEESDE